MESPSENLRRFQKDAEVDALLAHAIATGQNDIDEIRAALASLELIFKAFSYGEHPNFALLDRPLLQSYARGTAYIARAMVGSDRADLKSAGLQIIGLLDDPQLMDILSEALHSETTWLRLAAIEALSRMSAVYSRPVLETIAQHMDLVTRQAVTKALARLNN